MSRLHPIKSLSKNKTSEVTIDFIFGIPIVIVAAIIQTSILPRFPIFGLIPNLMLLIVVSWSILRGPNHGMGWAVIGGLALDLASGSLIGITSVSLLFAAVVAGLGYHRIKGHFVFSTFISLMSITVYHMIYLPLLAIMGHTVYWAEMLQQIVIPLIIIHILLLPVVYLGLSSLALLLSNQEPRISQWKSSSHGNV